MTDKQIAVYCAWCKKHIRGPLVKKGEPISHGVCKDCFVTEITEIMRINKNKQTNE